MQNLKPNPALVPFADEFKALETVSEKIQYLKTYKTAIEAVALVNVEGTIRAWEKKL
jgi:hypothetical protein